MNVEFNLPNPVNRDLLIEQLVIAGYTQYSTGQSTITVFNIQASDVTAIETLLAGHNASTLTENQKLLSAQQSALNQARDYLKRQLLNASPNIPTIYTTVKAYVDGNIHLQQMVANKMSLANLAHGWTVASMTNPVNNSDRARYLECALSIVGLLA